MSAQQHLTVGMSNDSKSINQNQEDLWSFDIKHQTQARHQQHTTRRNRLSQSKKVTEQERTNAHNHGNLHVLLLAIVITILFVQ